VQEAASCANKHFRSIGEPIDLEERQHLRVQQRIAGIEAIMIAVLTRELDTSQQDFGLFLHRRLSLRL